MRFLGAMLLMLLLGLLQLVSARPASSLLTAKEDHRATIDFFCHVSAVNILGTFDPAMDPRFCGQDRTDPGPPDAMNENTYASVFHRLKPGIVLVPRMNRTPKPKSVYRFFARAPGTGNCCEV